MISSNSHGIVRIHITTYEKKGKEILTNRMDRHSNGLNSQNAKFVCSICLNTKPKNEDLNKRKSQSCSICKHSCDFQATTKERVKREKPDIKKQDDISTKNIQTSRTDVAQGLNLLNEVLTVFQTKKHQEIKERNGKTIIVKDASVSTDCVNVLKPKLTLSRVFQFSIDEGNVNLNSKFCIVNSCQPEQSRHSIELIKHKSSSIPQMKMDELKNSLKEKTKSKDAIEEVNRMFATVKRERTDFSNRPMIRNGPRVLPVVKTSTFGNPAQNKSDVNIFDRSDTKESCKCCETNYYLSSGDSLAKQECCHHKCDSDRCDKNVYMMCCHYKNSRRDVETDVLVCERCRKSQNGHYEDECPDYN